MNSTVTRRQFIKISGAALTATALSQSGCSLGADTSIRKNKSKPDEIIPSYCDVCFMQCGINVSVTDGIATQIEGNPKHPLSRGKLCPRGTAGLGQLYDPDRLKSPLMRVRENGIDRFKVVSWDEALDFVAKKIRTIIDRDGVEALALMQHGKGSAPFVELWHALGTGTDGHPSSAQCRGARDLGWYLTFGATPGSPETLALDKSKVVAFFGSHLGENMHNTTLQDYTTGLRNGATHIVVDPRFSTAASKAKYWLQIKPATDIALMLAWMNVLINQNLYNKAFIEQHAVGFNELKEHVREFTPEWASKITDISVDLIEATAKELGRFPGETLVFPGRRFAWYGDDTQRARAMAILNALVGAWGSDSALFLGSSFKLPKYSKAIKNHSKSKKAFNQRDKFPMAGSMPVQSIMEASIPGRYESKKGKAESPLVKGWVVYSTNVTVSVPNGKLLVTEAAKYLDLLVVVETMPAEITGYADIVLPDTTYLERYDVLSRPSWREPFVAIRQPVVKPLYDSRPSWWIAKQLAERLEVGEYFPYEDYSEVIEDQLGQVNSSIEDINEKGGVLLKRYKKPTIKFKTPSKKIELYSKKLEKYGFEPMPVYTAIDEPPEGYYRLLYGRAPQHTFSRTTNNPMLNELYNENEVWVNDKVAQHLKVKHGSYVKLTNQDGVVSNKIRVRVTRRIRPDCVYMVHGWGREDRRLTKSFMRGASVNNLLTRYKEDPATGTTGSQVNFVTIEI